MASSELIDTIRLQKEEIMRLREDLSRNNSTIFQNKYKKALKDISSIIRANRQLKEELDKVRMQQIRDHQNDKQLEEEEFHKAYEKVLSEKNKMHIQIQNLNFQKEQLKYSVESLEEYVAQLKSEQMNMAREKEALERSISKKINHNPQGNSSKAALEESKDLQLLKQKQTEYLRRIQSYQEHHASLNKINRKLQTNIAELDAKLINNQRNHQSIIQSKNNQLHQLKNTLRNQYKDQINSLKKQNLNLKNQINELKVCLQSEEQNNHIGMYEGDKQYELQLIETLKELKGQMQPLKIQISSITQSKQNDKESTTREKANMKMKIIELQNKNQQTLANSKQLEHKLIMAHQKIRHYQDQQRLLKKLEEQNRILGGRVIVLESKDIALKNRNGQDLEEKVLQFQNRVQILLKDKQNISNIKNVTIHQLIALKAYIMELDAKLQAVISENQYSHKKYKSYKQKYTTLAKEAKNHQNIVNAYQNKIVGYDRLIVKMQSELQRVMGMYDLELKSINFKAMQQQNSMSIQVYKQKYMALQEKLGMQDRYSKQELQTVKLNYQTKLMEANIKIEQIKSLKSTIQLYKSKNDQLVNKLNKKDNQIFQLKLSFTQVNETIPHQHTSSANKYTQEFIQSLKNQVSQKQNIIIKMQSDFRGIEQQWRRKYQRVEQQNQQFKRKINSITFNQKSQMENKIYQMQQEIKRNKEYISEIQNQMNISKSNIWKNDQTDKKRQFIQKISNLQYEKEQLNNKNNLLMINKKKMENQIRQYQDQIQKLQNNLRKHKIQSKERIQQHLNLLSKKDQQLRIQSINLNSSFSDLSIKLVQSENKNHKLMLQIQSLRSQLQQTMNKSRIISNNDYINERFNDLKKKYQILEQQKHSLDLILVKIQNKNKQLNESLRVKHSHIQRIQYQLKNLKETNNNSQIFKLNQLNQQNSKKQLIINQMSHQINKLKMSLFQKDKQIDYYKQQLNHHKNILQTVQTNENALRQVLAIRNSNQQLKNGVQNLKLQINKKNGQLQTLKNQNKNCYQEINQIKTKIITLETQNINLQGLNNRLNSQVSRYQSGYNDRQNLIQIKDQTIFQLNSQLRLNSNIKNDLQQAKSIIDQKDQIINKLNKQIWDLQNQLTNKQLLEKDETLVNNLRYEINNIKADNMNRLNELQNQINEKDIKISKLQYQQMVNQGSHSQIQSKLLMLEHQIQRYKHDILQLEESKNKLQYDNINYQQNMSKMINEYNQILANHNQYKVKSQQYQILLTQGRKDTIQARNRIFELQNQLSDKQRQYNKIQYEINSFTQQMVFLQETIGQKDNMIEKKNDQITKLNQKINNQISSIADKQYSLTNAYKQLNILKKKYQSKQEELSLSENNRIQISHQFSKLQQAFNQSQFFNQQKNVQITRLKKQLSSQREDMRNQLNQKNQQISRINQQLFKNKIEFERMSRQEMNLLEVQCTKLKYKLNLQERQLGEKQNIIISLSEQIRQRKIEKIQNITYSEEDYNSLKQQINYLQTNINSLKRTISDHQFEKQQLQSKINYTSKTIRDQKIQYQQQVEKLKKQIQQTIQRQKRINREKQQVTTEEMKTIEQIKVGLLLYEKEIERLNQIVEELQQQISQLRIRLTYFINQQTRLQENLTTMALTFAEVQTFKDRMITKQNQISQVRNNLLGIGKSEKNPHMNQINQIEIQRGILPQSSSISSGVKQQQVKNDWHSDFQPKNEKNYGDYILQSDQQVHNHGVLKVEQPKQIRSRSLNRPQFLKLSQHSQPHPLQISHYNQLSPQPTLITQPSSQSHYQLQNALVPMQISQQRSVTYNLLPGKSHISQKIIVKEMNESFINQPRTQPHIQFTHLPPQQNLQQNVKRVTTQGNKISQQGWR